MDRFQNKARPIPPKVLAMVLGVVLLSIAAWFVYQEQKQPAIIDFESCAQAGNPILESYPEQCTYRGRSFTKPL